MTSAQLTEFFPDLNLTDFKLLCNIAYHGEVPSGYTLKSIASRSRVSVENLDSTLSRLRKTPYMQGGKVSPQYFFKVVKVMLEYTPQWEESFKSLQNFRYESSAYLWELGKKVAEEKWVSAVALKRPSLSYSYGSENGIELEQYIGELALNEESASLLGILSDWEQYKLILSLLENALRDNKITSEYIDTVEEVIEREGIKSVEAEDAVTFYRFLLEGNDALKTNDLKRKETLWSAASNAISLLYRDRLIDSLEAFTVAIEENSNLGKANGLLASPILSFYYALCLLRCAKSGYFNSDDIQDITEKFLKSRDVYYGPTYAATRILLTYGKSEDDQCSNYVAAEIQRMLEEDNCSLTRIFAKLLSGYFKCNSVNETVEIPSVGILKHELSTYHPIGVKERNELRSAFGGQPLLNAVRRREEWQILFSKINQNLLESQKVEKRLIYFMDALSLQNVIEQTRLPNGEWDSGVSISKQQFLNEKLDSMNESDKKVAYRLRTKEEEQSDASIVFEELCSSDRIFVGVPFRRPYIPVSVMVTSPYLCFETVGSEIHLSSNVGLNGNNQIPCNWIVSHEEDGSYKAIALNDIQKSILTQILSTPILPIQASSDVKALAKRLEGHIDVECNIANDNSIRTIKGSGIIAVRITPNDKNGGYLVQLLAAPVMDHPIRFPIGEGEATVYDQDEGHLVAIIRDLVEEQNNYEQLYSFIASNIGSVFIDYRSAQLSSSESLLSLLEYTNEHPESYLLEWPMGRELKFKGILKPSDIDVQVITQMNWFEVQGKVALSGSSLSFHELLALYRDTENEGYIKIGENEYMKMTDALKKNIEQLNDVIINHDRKGKIDKVGKYDVGRLAEILGEDGGLHAEMDEDFIGLLKKMQDSYNTAIDVPQALNANLREYQKEGFQWLARLTNWGAGACLADDMGLGKTVQSIALMLYRAHLGPSLVVAPKSLVLNWEKEIRKFAPTLRPINLNDEKNKKGIIENIGCSDVVITTYGILVTQKDILCSKKWNVICLDEAHCIKNRMTRTSRSAMSLSGDAKIILTGTPLQNHLGEMWNLFQFINPGMLGPWQQFVDKYIKSPSDDIVHRGLKDRTLPFILRRTKEDVLGDLPDKISYEQMVELSPEETEIYEKVRSDVELKFKKHKTTAEKMAAEKLDLMFFQELTRLRLLSNSVSLAFPEWNRESSKVAALRDILTSLSTRKDNQVLIFSQFTSFLAQIGTMMKEAGFEYLYLDGQTSLNERQKLVDRFQAGEAQFFLISLKAGGLGLNLTAANYVILTDPWWNPSIENQATDRAHRIGQERNVTVIRLISANTIEEKILKLHEQKQDLSDRILEGTSGTASLTMHEILDMISPYR